MHEPLNKTAIDRETLSGFSLGKKKETERNLDKRRIMSSAEKIFERTRNVYLDEIIVQDNYRGSSAR